MDCRSDHNVATSETRAKVQAIRLRLQLKSTNQISLTQKAPFVVTPNVLKFERAIYQGFVNYPKTKVQVFVKLPESEIVITPLFLPSRVENNMAAKLSDVLL